MGIGWTDLCIDRLQVWADKSCLHRFDRFNNKRLGRAQGGSAGRVQVFSDGAERAAHDFPQDCPLASFSLTREYISEDEDNAMGGRYLAELSRAA